jgi:hypothetical protein
MVPGRRRGYPEAMRPTRLLLALLASAISLPATSAAQSPSAPVVEAVRPLAEAVSFLPPGGTDLAFTDWARIRASQGAEDLTGASPFDDKAAFLLSTARQEAAASQFGLAHLRTLRDTWGFDALDLGWETTISLDGPPVSVLRFRDGFDLEALQALFDARGFSTTRVADATVRSHDLDISADWIGKSELAILNTAFLDDGRTLVLSSGIDGLEAVVRAPYQRGLPNRSVSDVVGALEGASAAWLVIGLGACVAFTPPPFDLSGASPSSAALPSGGPLHPYGALGVAYGRPDWRPVGRIVMAFPDAGWAAADLGPRVQQARTGSSLVTKAPYAESVLSVQDARVADRVLEVDVTPAEDMPQRLFRMLLARDMTFAGC